MNKILTIIFVLFGAVEAFSQSQFSRISIGVNAGITSSFSDLSYGPKIDGSGTATKSFGMNKSKSFGGSLDYNFTPFVNAGLEYNSVQLKDGADAHNRKFISDFSSIELRGQVSAGQFVDFSYSTFLHSIRHLNASLGVAFISGKNNVLDFTDPEESEFKRQHGNDIGKSEFKNVLGIPVGLGYNFIFYNQYEEPSIILGLNYKTVFTFSDDIDGYNDDPKIFNNKSKDIYSVFGISLKYTFGPRSLYY